MVNVIVLNVEPRTAFWLALFTMLFGFGSGVVKHYEQETINPRLVGRYLMMAVPGAIVGTIILPYIKTSLLLIGKNAFRGNNENIVFITNIAAVFSILRNEDFLASNEWEQLFSIMVFVAPAVVIGGQIGPRIPSLISKEVLIKYVGILLLGVSYFMVMRGFAIL